jgi:hypothetical protein
MPIWAKLPTIRALRYNPNDPTGAGISHTTDRPVLRRALLALPGAAIFSGGRATE